MMFKAADKTVCTYEGVLPRMFRIEILTHEMGEVQITTPINTIHFENKQQQTVVRLGPQHTIEFVSRLWFEVYITPFP